MTPFAGCPLHRTPGARPVPSWLQWRALPAQNSPVQRKALPRGRRRRISGRPARCRCIRARPPRFPPSRSRRCCRRWADAAPSPGNIQRGNDPGPPLAGRDQIDVVGTLGLQIEENFSQMLHADLLAQPLGADGIVLAEAAFEGAAGKEHRAAALCAADAGLLPESAGQRGRLLRCCPRRRNRCVRQHGRLRTGGGRGCRKRERRRNRFSA